VRVLHVHSGNIYGGIERILVALADSRQLVPDLAHHFAICFEDRLTAELRALGVPVGLLARASRPWAVLAARRRLAELVRAVRPDVVLCHAPWPLAMFGSTLRRLGASIVFWLHGAVTGRHWLERLARHTSPSAFICNSLFTASTLELLYPAATGTVIHPPVPSVDVPNRRDVRHALRWALETPEHVVVILQVGRLEVGKGFDILLHALEALPQALDWVTWVVGGAATPSERAHERHLRELADALGIAARVRFLGSRADVADLLSAGDIYVQANSRPEGFGISLVEALYAGLPVLTSRIGAAPEIVNDRCGRLVSPDSQALSEALAELVRDAPLRERLGMAGPLRAREVCAPAQQIAKLHEMLREVAAA
jgi:glycosyltransferase involved in cell wall biosynthesis